jgi:alkanesulfonate monooxygenase SsuD/methylene tetrahydromethanopterin reductase-like flavin-dependent oxidoreductase (luciferase family)
MIHHGHSHVIVIVINGPSYQDWEHKQDVGTPRSASAPTTDSARPEPIIAAGATSGGARRRGEVMTIYAAINRSGSRAQPPSAKTGRRASMAAPAERRIRYLVPVPPLESGRVLATFEGHIDRVTACAATAGA